MPRTTTPKPDLKEACITAAHEVIAERGVEGLSLRDVARKLNVSHQAPYRHFPSRDHLLAEIMRRCFDQFAQYLDARPASDTPHVDLGHMGERYLHYAASHPLEYRLMFGTPWPEPAEHPDLVKHAVHAFDVLRKVLRKMHHGKPDQNALADLDALFIWSSMHGMASITQANVMPHLKLSKKVMNGAAAHLMYRMSLALPQEES
jgi:AcrR family transcriptional regulator